jgi:DNA-binding NarL/FixJ family response regulator
VSGGAPHPAARVLVVDDSGFMRLALRRMIGAEGDLAVVGEAADGHGAVEAAARLRPDLVVMDVAMPRLDGLEATRRITSEPGLAGTRVIVLTTFELDEYVFGALRAGASGFLLKDIDPPDLLTAVRVVADGEALLAPRLTRRLIEAFVEQERAARSAVTEGDELEELTPREREVLELVGRGLSNAEIADELVLSPLTAKTHVARLFSKLDARDRAQLVVIAYETGLVVPGER